MNNTIAEIFRLGKPNNEGHNFGVEIELENITRHERVVGWEQEHDGSLRDNGREFIFNGAADLEKSKKRLEVLHNHFEKLGIKPKASNLTSTHIHIDVRLMTVKELLSFVACLMVVELDLAIASGEDRLHNYFALTTSESDHRLRDLMDVKTDEDFVKFVKLQNDKDVRYCGINFNSIKRHGSLEVRYLGGQADPRNVYPWLEFYKNLKVLACEGLDFQALFQSISERGLDDVKLLFNPNFALTQENVLEGLRNAQDFIFHLEYERINAPRDGNGLATYYR